MNKIMFVLPFAFFLNSMSLSVDYISIDPQEVELSYASKIVIEKKEEKRFVRLHLCTSPHLEESLNCGERAIKGPTFEWSDYLDHLHGHLGLKQEELSASELKEKESLIRWTRKVLKRNYHEHHAQTLYKEHFENLLNDMVFSLDPEIIEEKVREKKERIERVTQYLESDAQDSAVPVIFENLHPKEFALSHSPFLAWMNQNICHCTLSLTHSKNNLPHCLLKKGDKVLAYAPAYLVGCSTRRSCERHKWFNTSESHQPLNFLKAVEDSCQGYYLARSGILSFSQNGSEKRGN